MSYGRIRLFQTETFRLAAIYVGLFLGSMLFLLALIYFIVSNAFESDLLRNSRDDLAAIRKAYVLGTPKNKSLHEAKEMIDDRLLASDAADLFLLQKDGVRVAGNLPTMAAQAGMIRMDYPLPSGARAGSSGRLLGAGELLAPGIYAFVGRDLYATRHAEDRMVLAFAAILLLTLILSIAGGLVLSRSFVRRIDSITATCRSIMAGRLNDRIPVRGARNELDQLGSTINDMLDRINSLMEGVRQVSNDIAHDLGTPLTHLRNRLERARRDPHGGTDAIEAAIADCDELIAMFAALLRIAQIESGARRAGMQTIDLADVLRSVVTLYIPALDDAGHPVTADIAPGLRMLGDPQLLFRLFANLLDNASRHTPRGTPISVIASHAGTQARVTVADSGEGIPAEDRELVFRRFYRRERSRTTPGSGLGLALAEAIADLHGAHVALEDNKPGLRVVLTFPLTEAAALPRAAE
jgi:signal transduction histidine kinase